LGLTCRIWHKINIIKFHFNTFNAADFIARICEMMRMLICLNTSGQA
jgi:hypothetical protein